MELGVNNFLDSTGPWWNQKSDMLRQGVGNVQFLPMRFYNSRILSLCTDMGGYYGGREC